MTDLRGREGNGIEESDNRRSLAWRVFFEATTRLQGVLETRLKEGAGMTLADYNILITLYESPEHTMRMGELAEQLGFIPSRLTYLVTRLVGEGWLEKVPSGTDRRGYNARLTPKGAQATELGARIHQKIVRKLLLDDLTDQHIDQVVEVFAHLEERVRDI